MSPLLPKHPALWLLAVACAPAVDVAPLPTEAAPLVGDQAIESHPGASVVGGAGPNLVGLPMAGDFDGDAYSDIVLVTADDTAFVFFGGPQRLLRRMQLDDADAVARVATWPTVGDVDGDGRDDLVTREAGRVVVYPGARWSGVVPDPEVTDLATGDFGPFAVGDLDGDGATDLVVGTGSEHRVVSRGRVVHTLVDLGPDPSFAGGDFDGDGVGDLLALEAIDPEDAFKPRKGVVLSALSGEPETTQLPLKSTPDWINGVGDLDGDGADEVYLAVAPPRGDEALLLRHGTDVVAWPGAPDLTYPIGDIDGDGLEDSCSPVPNYDPDAQRNHGGRAEIRFGGVGTVEDPPSPAAVLHSASSRGARVLGAATGLGDVDGDGYDEFALIEIDESAYLEDPHREPFNVYLIRGAPRT